MSVRLQSAPFNTGQEITDFSVKHPDAGACASFLGQMRAKCQEGPLKFMLLEHYPALALKQLQAIEALACQRWPLLDTMIIHRFGKIYPSEPIVLVAALSESRQPAFNAVNFIMDFLKTDAPFWKSEYLEDGRNIWVSSRQKDITSRDRWALQETI